MISDWLIQTFLRNFPRMWHKRLMPSKQVASSLPLPSILVTWAYSWPSSLKTSSRLRPSFSFLPRRRFLPPFPLFLGIVRRYQSSFLVWEEINYEMNTFLSLQLSSGREGREADLASQATIFTLSTRVSSGRSRNSTLFNIKVQTLSQKR